MKEVNDYLELALNEEAPPQDEFESRQDELEDKIKELERELELYGLKFHQGKKKPDKEEKKLMKDLSSAVKSLKISKGDLENVGYIDKDGRRVKANRSHNSYLSDTMKNINKVTKLGNEYRNI